MTWRTLTPLGWIATLVAATVLFVLVASFAGFRFDPFELERRRGERAEARAERAESDAKARALEAEGERELAGRAAAATARSHAAARSLQILETLARSAPDANAPLDPARADRLRAHDRELCGISPDLGGCAAEADSAAGGGHALRPAAASGPSHPV